MALIFVGGRELGAEGLGLVARDPQASEERVLALCWRAVDFTGSVIRVRASYAAGALTSPKSGKVRAVPLAPDVASALAQLGQRQLWTGDDDLVFPGPAGSYRDGSGLRK